MKNKADNIIDKLYDNRRLLLRYFLFALIASFIRYALTFYFSKITLSGGDILVWTTWAIIFYPLLKLFVFRQKAAHIYELMRQIIIYILAVTALWITNQVILSVFYALTASPALSLSLSGMITEVMCLWLMWKVVFKIKK